MSGTNFFDFREQVTRRAPRATPAASASAPGAAEAMTVSQLTARIDSILKKNLPPVVLVKGEISNCNLHRASGILYFTLKDEDACLDCVMFRTEVARLKFRPADGMEMLAHGRISVYAQRGRYQLYASTLQPLGQGALELAFRQMREKLEREGLFAAERKRTLPMYPQRIALLTSRATAALQDMLKVLRRYPWLRLFLFHVPVQGDGSAEQIARALQALNGQAQAIGGIDVILLARGGGSLEDLWAFNEEVIARAIAASAIPVVTGIGHEVDVSIADLVADHHAHTPTEAAQVVVGHWRSACERMQTHHGRLIRALRHSLQSARHRVGAIERHELFRRPTDRINQLRQLLDDRQRALSAVTAHRLRRWHMRLDQLSRRLIEQHPRHQLRLQRQQLIAIEQRLAATLRQGNARRRLRLDALAGHLEAISPAQVLKRGYSITTRRKDGTILRSAGDIRPGDRLVTRLADGTIESTADDPRQPRLFD